MSRCTAVTSSMSANTATSPTENRLIARVGFSRCAMTGYLGPSQIVPVESPSNSMLGIESSYVVLVLVFHPS